MSNFTKEQEAALTAHAEEHGSVSYEDCKEFAREWGLRYRQVISKVGHMNLPYTAVEKAPKRPRGKTKTEIVAEIAEAAGVEASVLDGLNKATSRSLDNLLGAL